MTILHESEYIRPCEKHVIEANKEYWKNSFDINEGTDWIYVFHSVAEEFETVFREDLFAKGLQEREGLPIVSVFCVNKQPSGNDLDLSFGIHNVMHLIPEKFNSIISRVRTYICAKIFAFATYNKKSKLFQIRYRGIPCGDAISDTIIRDGSLDVDKNREFNFDYFNISWTLYCKYIRYALSVVDHAYMMFKKKRPAYVISAERVYSQSLFLNVASLFGATIFATPFDLTDTLQHVLSGGKILSTSDLHGRKIESFLEKNMIQMSNVWQENIETLLLKRETVYDLRSCLGIKNGKKNIFIMLHAFADAPREYCKQNIYCDYNEWFLDTLRIIKDIKNVNWIIKDHPAATFYGQESYVKRVCAQYKSENIFWCNKDVTCWQIKEIADCIVTSAGTVGIEYWAYGIPTITIADIYYSRWGISYNLKSRKEYENTLRHIDMLAKPSDESILKAQKIIIAQKEMMVSCLDKLGSIFSETYTKRLETLCKVGNKGEDALYSFCEKVLLLLREKGIKDSRIYKNPNIIEG